MTLAEHKILVILAHPDDESFGMGGTLAQYASAEAEITLVIATGGEQGDVPESYLASGQSVKDIRVPELDCAVKTLGISRLIRLGYHDSGMKGTAFNQDPAAFIQQPQAEVSKRLLEIMQETQPAIVLTHNAKGDYGHPDHIHVHQNTLEAFTQYRKGLQNGENTAELPVLYTHMMPKAMLKAAVFYYRLIGKDPRHFGENGDVDLVDLVEHEFPEHVRIDYRRFRKVKEQASACHASQGAGKLASGLAGLLQTLIEKPFDSFTQLIPPPESRQALRTDLFEGKRA